MLPSAGGTAAYLEVCATDMEGCADGVEGAGVVVGDRGEDPQGLGLWIAADVLEVLHGRPGELRGIAGE